MGLILGQVQLRDEGGAPVIGVNVRLSRGMLPSAKAEDDKPSDDAGNLSFPHAPNWPEGYSLYVNYANERRRYGRTTARVTSTTQDVQITVPANTREVRVEGPDLIDEDDRRISLAGTDGQLDYRYWLDGREDKLQPFLNESVAFGFQLRRVFLEGAKLENTVFDLDPRAEPDFYPELVPFVRFQNENGTIPLLTVGVDEQDLLPTLDDRVRHWDDVNAALAGHGLLYGISGWNEANKNGGGDDGPYLLSAPPANGPLFWSRGSRTQDTFYQARGANGLEFHPVRGFDRESMDLVASAIFIRDNGGANVLLLLDEPIPFGENNIDGKESNDPKLAYRLAAVAQAHWAVAVFHNRNGQRGQLMSDNVRRCAEAWVRGMRA